MIAVMVVGVVFGMVVNFSGSVGGCSGGGDGVHGGGIFLG